jgi:hypothetical protein
MTAPRHLDHEQGGPEVEELRQTSAASRHHRDAPEKPARAEVEAQPEELRLEDGAPRQRDDQEGDLRQGRVDGQHGRVVDQPMVHRAEIHEFGCRGRETVRIDSRKLDVSVPQVAVDVVRERWDLWEQDEPHGDREQPDEQTATGTVQHLCGGERVDREGRGEENECGPWVGRAGPPAHRGEQGDLGASCRDEDRPGGLRLREAI